MKETKPYQNRIHIFHHTDGKLWTFENIQEACRYITSIRAIGEVGSQFTTFSYHQEFADEHYGIQIYRHSEVIIRDDYGEIVHLQDLIDEWNKRFKSKYRWKGPRRLSGSKYSSYRWFRALRTTNERRQAVENWDAYDDYGIVVKPRGKRNVNSLPNSWDDYCRSQNHSWKKHRKTQWR